MKTLALLYPGCIEFEILLACEILHHHLPIDVVTPTGEDHKGSNGMTIRAQRSLTSADPAQYKVALVPGGDPGSMIGNVRLSQILRAIHANGGVIAAICAGPVLLDQAGLLEGRRIAHGYKGPQLEYLNKNGFFKQTELTTEAVITEHRIVTARPDSFIDFAVEVATLAGVSAPERATFWKSYYRGQS